MYSLCVNALFCLCYNFSLQTVHPSGLFAAYHTHLVYTNHFCSFGSSQMPHITHLFLSWTVSVLLPNRKKFIWVNHMPYITHTLIRLTVSVALPNSTQFIWVNRMLCITHAFIWLPVSFVPPHRKQFIELNSMPFIAHANKTWTMFDAFVIANVLHISHGFHIAPFAIIASHIVSRRVSYCSLALAASCSSDLWDQALHKEQRSVG